MSVVASASNDSFERWLARQEHRVDVLDADFRHRIDHLDAEVNSHKDGPGHGSADLLARIQRLEGMVLKIGGAVIVLQLGMLGTLLKLVLKL